MSKEITRINVTQRGRSSRRGCGRCISRRSTAFGVTSDIPTWYLTNCKFSLKPDDWPKCIQRFERFRKAAGLDEQRGENLVNTLIYAMDDQADDILVFFKLTAEQEKVYEQVKEKFENYFIVKRNIIFEQAKFYSRKQQLGEPENNFITDQNNLAR